MCSIFLARPHGTLHPFLHKSKFHIILTILILNKFSINELTIIVLLISNGIPLLLASLLSQNKRDECSAPAHSMVEQKFKWIGHSAHSSVDGFITCINHCEITSIAYKDHQFIVSNPISHTSNLLFFYYFLQWIHNFFHKYSQMCPTLAFKSSHMKWVLLILQLFFKNDLT